MHQRFIIKVFVNTVSTVCILRVFNTCTYSQDYKPSNTNKNTMLMLYECI